MKHQNHLSTLLLYCVWLPSLFAQTPPAKIDAEAFLTQAVLSGLEEDIFPKQIANYILAHQEAFFVPKCPICSPVKRAFSRYITQAPTNQDTKASAEILAQLQHQDRSIAQEAFKELINRYTTQAMARANYTPSQQENLRQQLAVGRKRGMGYKSEAFGKFCPSCDGACQVK